MKKKEAQNLSIKKWAMIVCGATYTEISNKFRYLEGECGLCEKYAATYNSELAQCAECPIRPDLSKYDDRTKPGCNQKFHPFHQWIRNKTRANAIEVLKLILNS